MRPRLIGRIPARANVAEKKKNTIAKKSNARTAETGVVGAIALCYSPATTAGNVVPLPKIKRLYRTITYHVHYGSHRPEIDPATSASPLFGAELTW